MTTTYWKGTGTQSSPASGNWYINEGSDWSTGQAPGTYQSTPVDTVFNGGSYTVSVENDQYNQALNTYYSFIYPYEVASITIQTGAAVTFQSAPGQIPPGLQSDGALNNHGSVTFNVGGTGVSAVGAANTGNLTIAGGVFANSGTFTNGGTTTISGGSFTNNGTFVNAKTLNINSATAASMYGFTNTGTITIGANAGGLTIETSLVASSNSGQINVNSNTTLQTSADITNTGTISVSGTLVSTGLFQGGGSIVLSNGTISGPFDENADNTISGYGTVSLFANNGVVEATGGTLTADVFNNSGLIEATDDQSGTGGILVIVDAVRNAGGTIAAYLDGNVEITGTVTGGTVQCSNAGDVSITGTVSGASIVQTGGVLLIDGTVQSGTLSGSIAAIGGALDGTSGAVANQGTLSVNEIVSYVGGSPVYSPGSLTLKGTISNTGTIDVSGPDAQASLLAGSPTTTLQGGGQVILSDGGANLIDATAAGNQLVNVDNTISGNGALGLGNLILNNQGTVDAMGGSPLVVQLNAKTASANTGTMEATGGGEIQFVKGLFTNNGIIDADGTSDVEFANTATITNGPSGTIEATNGGVVYIDAPTRHAAFFTNQGLLEAAAGSTVTVGQGATTNDVGGTLTGGTWEAAAGGTLSLAGSVITTDAAKIILSGTGSVIQSGTGAGVTSLQQSLMTIATGGSLGISGGSYTFVNAITLNGTLNVSRPPSGNASAVVFTSGLITGSAGSTITGFNGTIASSLTTAGSVVAQGLSNLTFTGANDTFSGALSGQGLLVALVFAAGTDTIASGATLTSAMTDITGATVVLGENLTDIGNLSMSSGTLSLGSDTWTVAGTSNQSGTSSLTGGTVLGPGTLAFGAKVTSSLAGVTFSGASLTNAGALSVSGAVALGGASGGTDAITNQSGGTFALADGGSIGVASGVTGTFTNAGTLQRTSASGTGTDTIATGLTSSGTIDVQGGTLAVTGAVALTGILSLENGGVFTSGLITASSASSIVAAGNGTIASSLNDAGAVSETQAGGTLAFTGTGDTFAGALKGAGTIAFTAGTDALNTGISFSTKTILLNGGAVTLGATLADSSGFAMSGGSLALGGNGFTVTGAAALSGGTLLGTGKLQVKGATTLSGLTVSGATLQNVGTLTQSGALNLGGTGADQVNNLSGATYTLGDGAGVAVTGTATTAMANAGTLQKTAGTGIASVGTSISNNGTINAASGTLELQGAVGGTGQLILTGPSILQADASVATTQALNFSGAGGDLILHDAKDFHASVTGFTTGDTIDFGSFSTTNETLAYTGNGSTTAPGGTLSVKSGTNAASIVLHGTYSLSNFHIGTDNNGGTALTFHT